MISGGSHTIAVGRVLVVVSVSEYTSFLIRDFGNGSNCEVEEKKSSYTCPSAIAVINVDPINKSIVLRDQNRNRSESAFR